MARFDVFESARGGDLLLDCQADALAGLNTRLVAPLMQPNRAPKPAGRLNPSFEIDGTNYIMVTQYAGAVELRELGQKMASLSEHDREIVNALDFLITGV